VNYDEIKMKLATSFFIVLQAGILFILISQGNGGYSKDAAKS